jgi:hypothetical protein
MGRLGQRRIGGLGRDWRQRRPEYGRYRCLTNQALGFLMINEDLRREMGAAERRRLAEIFVVRFPCHLRGGLFVEPRALCMIP